MRETIVESLTIRTATSLSRRTSLLALGGAALAASFDSIPALAGKANKNKKAKKRCKRQVGQCEEAIVHVCDAPDLRVTEAECLALLRPCCQPFKECQAAEVFDCLEAAAAVIAPPPP